MGPEDLDIQKLPLEEQWVKALEDQDGFSLMKLLVEEPRLVSIRCGRFKSSNVLHLAVRKNWYGLVLEVAEIFSPSGESRRRVLQPQVLADLLTEKEDGDHGGYSSGLDVLAMASINCNKAINTLLARTINCAHPPGAHKSWRLFGNDHPYKKVMTSWRTTAASSRSEIMDAYMSILATVRVFNSRVQ
ncbi:hypothetical protein R1sor_002514 [Riccia sorocarpa]|uniref:Uncharacterized protein n=1 Tax=Riccia sorocarpa TaxID=122646 RepID=A0ABD3H1N2_9MARC